MKKTFILLLFTLIVTGCPNTDLLERVQVKIVLAGLDFTSSDPDSLKSAVADIFSDFEHTYEHTDLSFWSDRSSYNYSTGTMNQGINASMAVGTYQVDGYGGWAFALGSPFLSFQVHPRQIEIQSSTSEIELLANPDCGLILIADPHDQLEEAYIAGYGNPGTPLFRQGIYWYSYVLPDPVFQAHIIKKNAEELVFNLNIIRVGNTYKIEIIQ